MAQPQQDVTISAPGFAGLNTQDSPLDMDPTFASVADNCVIDNYGRVSSRRGFNYLTTNPEVLNGDPIQAMGEFITAAGMKWLFCAGGEKLWIQETTGTLELVGVTLPAAYVITDNNWQIISFNDKCYFVQAGHGPLVFDPAISTTAVHLLATTPFFTAAGHPNTAHAAFGRLWFSAFDNDSTLVAWSGLLDGENWDSLGWGTLQTSEYWPSGFDEITSLVAHNNFMCFFGKRNILLYNTTADVVSTLRLADAIEGLGCIARDSLVPTGTDYMFIDATGVRSLNRTIQEKSVPIGDISRNVRQEFQEALAREPSTDIRAVYHVEDSFYACFLPHNKETYVFDTWSPLQTGAARVTKWQQQQPLCATRTADRQTYFGGGGGVFHYTGAQDTHLELNVGSGLWEAVTTHIALEYWTHPLDFGSPAKLVFPKHVHVVLFGGLLGKLCLAWSYDYSSTLSRKCAPLSTDALPAFWDTDAEWDTDDSYTSGENINQLSYNIWGSGRNIKLGLTSNILGSTISIQEINIQALQGRII